MKRKDLVVFFGLELGAILFAIIMFRSFSPKPAGVMAGSYFVLSGAYMLAKAWQWPDRKRSATLYVLLVHVFAVSIPMLATRVSHWEVEFTSLKVMGIPGPQFHDISSTIFSLLIGATILDWLRLSFFQRQAPSN